MGLSQREIRISARMTSNQQNIQCSIRVYSVQRENEKEIKIDQYTSGWFCLITPNNTIIHYSVVPVIPESRWYGQIT